MVSNRETYATREELEPGAALEWINGKEQDVVKKNKTGWNYEFILH